MIKTANLTGSVSRNAGGLYESVRRLVQSLMQEGVDVRVFGAMDEFTAADVAAWSPVPVLAFKPSWPEAFGFSPEFLSELLAYRPDLTHTHGIWRYTSMATNNYCRAMKNPYIISPHGMLDQWAVRNSRWKKTVAHALYEGAHLRGAACLRALCESEARSFRQAGLINPICVIPNGIDLPVSPKAEKLKTEMLKWEGGSGNQRTEGANAEILKAEKLKLENGNPPSSIFQAPSSPRRTLLYLGRIHPKKGLVNLIKAWAVVQKPEARSQKPEWMLEIAGWDQGGHEDELKRLATELGIAWADARGKSENLKTEILKMESAARQEREADFSVSAFQNVSIMFSGPQFGEDKAACYRNCDAFILPSFSEGLPMVVLEAWAHGKPVLMTPECNLPEGFAAGAALHIETGPDSIAQGLQSLFEMSADERRQMGGRGLQLAATQFSWNHIAKELKQVYEWMLGGGPEPASFYPG